MNSSDEAAPGADDRHPPPRATRRRGTALTRAIYLTTLEELADSSFEELSFDKIAKKAGAGKASLYRRWNTPAELVLDALTDPDCGFAATPDPATGSLREDLLTLLNGFARALDQPHGRALRPLMTQRGRHPRLYDEVFRRVVEPRQQLILHVLRAAADRGEADPAAVTARVAALGPRLVIAEHIHTGAVPAAETAAIVDEVILRLTRPGSPDPSN
ncbi:TetR/AcrR family transcriptional regulator [Streptomyces sp. SL13]|uniref:TetR/AcrR family transcriptional regulator n=1 Tax=Streptantibioticus silvisoli TaxID=2705255 RepID=A0AA90H3J9_9ACTN|nr:TetR/AcrR family transcriptional regulator [Streptantibioticus silvisoli]MDI5969617.1 TetR/AcrR family transcriptional regulator [Streptantibioticus silvisoli]